MPPEFWLLPSSLPMHPAKMWCYCRMVYMPMSYLYGGYLLSTYMYAYLTANHLVPLNGIDHGWQVPDSTAEGLKCCLLMSMFPEEIVGEKMEPQQLYDAVNAILSLQRKNGGVAVWEPAGAQEWLEVSALAIDVYSVIEHEYIECTASSVHALVPFKKLYPGHKKKEMDNFITNAVRYLEHVQMPDADGSCTVGNPLICPTVAEPECHGMTLMPMSMNLNGRQAAQPSGRSQSHKIAIAFGSSIGCLSLMFLILGILLWWRRRRNEQIFFDVKDWHYEEVSLGNLRRFPFRELQIATHNFSSKNILGKGGFGNVYKGVLQDGTIIAVKRLKDGNAVGGKIQFQTEVEMINFAVHRNLLRLYGFCLTSTEKLLVYPCMSNDSAASILNGNKRRVPRKTDIGLGHQEANCSWGCQGIAIPSRAMRSKDNSSGLVGDFGLAKLLDHQDSHVTTAVRGTVGHIAPEYLSTGQSSDKTDVFGFGILLLELITDQRALEFGKNANQKGAMLDWVRKIYQEKKLEVLVDKDLKNNYDRIELEEMIQVALLCTQYLPVHRPKMSEVVRMLEGDGLAERWEASQRSGSTKCKPPNEFSSSDRYSDLMDDSLLVQAMELSGPR
ncbi:putative LRR receptor-like serine/threonine-protein kinase [Hibiscus syriacus]|uniref:non-specific serine/threonine protein kinase n=1 Tax=Hibiscus syriacus TaxID=106335 RepID=A0A6A2XJM9_HIBSY|nr:putative LRR receptor-like serine/threonine-protein kinase [Hibiscus syriacus]